MKAKRIVFTALLALLAGLAGAARSDEIDLSPAAWEDGEAEKFYELNKRMDGKTVLASGEHGVITGTTGAPAVRAGLEALNQGGSAADAVLATSLTQITLAAGSWVSYAGILTMVYYDAETGKYYNLNAGYNTVLGEDSPKTIPAQQNLLAPTGEEKPAASGRTALVPGYMAGVEAAHARFGKLPFGSLFSAALHYAENGFEFTEFHQGMVSSRKSVLSRLPATRAVFTKDDGSWYAAGDLFRQPELAATLHKVAGEGSGCMYSGEWARRFVAAVQKDGGRMTMEDMKRYAVIWSEPIEISYAGYEIHAHGLPAQGGVHVAEALNVCTQAKLAGLGHYSESPEAFFWMSQITNLFGLSFLTPQLQFMVLGGAETSLASRATVEHAERLWPMMAEGKFMLTRAPKDEDPRHSDAVVAIDRWGNVAALVHTINTASWGQTGIFVDGVSIPDSAAFQQQLIAQTGPGKRLPDPTEPLIIARDGKPVAGISSIGSGLHQKTVSVLVNLLAFDMGLERSIDAASLHLPRFGNFGSSKAQIFEGDFSEELIAGVRRLGLEVEVLSIGPESRAARGYAVGASISDEGIRRAVNAKSLNGQALGH